MTLGTMLIWISIISVILTAIFHFGFKKVKSPIVSFLQNFCGVLFIFSGWVKAVDSMGTAFKMEEYFTEFQMTFQETAVSFIAPVFPFLAEYALAFSVVMILLETVVGFMLVIGAKSKLTSWAFLLIIVFFTILTGFTFLTGYVPSGENFFSFSKWGPYLESNMRVTDCGCFGEFIKPTPKSTFLKNVVFLIPAFVFVFKHKDFHRFFKPVTRNVLSWLAGIALLWYCLNNFAWNLPHIDFRPFHEGVNIRDQRNAEIEAAQNVDITAFLLKDNKTGTFLEMPRDAYYAKLKDNAAEVRERYTVEEHIKEEPAIPLTKLSEILIEDFNGYEVTDSILNDVNYNLWIISYELPYDLSYEDVTVKDTSFTTDTVEVFEDGETSLEIVRSIDQITDRTVSRPVYSYHKEIVDDYKELIVPLANAAADDGYKTRVVVGAASEEEIRAFQKNIGAQLEIYEADDILLKTIIRSNPGVILMKDGMIIKKWHRKKLPSWGEIMEDYGIK